MTDRDRKDLQEFRMLYAALSADGKSKTNNALFNGHKRPGKVFDARAAFPKRASE